MRKSLSLSLLLPPLLAAAACAGAWDGAGAPEPELAAALAPQSAQRPGANVAPLAAGLDISVREQNLPGRPGLHLVVVATYKTNPNNSRYFLSGHAGVAGSQVAFVIDGLGEQKGGFGFDGVGAPAMEVELPDANASYQLSVRNGANVDLYTLTVTNDEVTVAPAGSAQFTSLTQRDYQRVPRDSVWVHIGTSDHAFFAPKIKAFEADMAALGATQYKPRPGVAAYGACYGLTSLRSVQQQMAANCLTGSYADDFLYYKYSGSMKDVETVIRRYKGWPCVSGTQHCMLISASSWSGETVMSWLL